MLLTVGKCEVDPLSCFDVDDVCMLASVDCMLRLVVVVGDGDEAVVVDGKDISGETVNDICDVDPDDDVDVVFEATVDGECERVKVVGVVDSGGVAGTAAVV